MLLLLFQLLLVHLLMLFVLVVCAFVVLLSDSRLKLRGRRYSQSRGRDKFSIDIE
jgi:hypothetical protein